VMQDRNEKLVKAEFDVWLSRDMSFNNPPGRHIHTYHKYVKAKKVKYTKKIQKCLDRMESKRGTGRGRAVAIKLGGNIRYVWRSDLLSKKEYNEIQEEQRSKLGVFCKKLRGDVGKDSPSR